MGGSGGSATFSRYFLCLADTLRHAKTGAPPWMANRYADLRPVPLPKVEEKTRLIIVAREDLGKSTWHWSMEDMEECQVTMKQLHLRTMSKHWGSAFDVI